MTTTRKIVVRQMSIILSTIDLPVYTAIVLAPIEQYKELLLVVATVIGKLLLVYLEFRQAKDELLNKQ